MRLILLTAGVSLVALLGLLIDAQSQIPVDRPAPSGESPTIFASGRIEGATPEIELLPRLSGRIVEVLVEEGQTVRRGEVLLRLDDRQHRHQVAQAEADLALAKAQLERLVNGARSQERAEATAQYEAKRAMLERAELSWERTRNLRQARAVSQQEADDKRTLVDSLTAEVAAAKARLELVEAPARPDEVQIARARILAAEAALELAKVQLERTELRSPSAGQILQINVEGGELTGPSGSEPAVVMADTSRYRVRAFVEELDAPRVQVGMAATIRADGLPDRTLQGRVTRLSPRMTRKQLFSDHPTERYDTKTREVWFELERGEGLVVGLPVDVTIDPGTRDDRSTESMELPGPTPREAPAVELNPLAQSGPIRR